MADQAVQRGLETRPSGAAVAWRNDSSGASGTVTPLRTYRSRGGYYCREYEEVLVIGERVARYRGTACRDASGEWRFAD